MRGEISSGRHAKRHPLDWYVDEIWCARQLAAALGDFERERALGHGVWDPSCGLGNTLQAAWELGLQTYGSDLVDNFAWEQFDACPDLARPRWFSGNFLHQTKAPGMCSIICNPPYSYIKGIAEDFARKAMSLANGRVCFLMPNKWLSSQARFNLFAADHPPQAILHLTQRPSMPPGDRIAAMGNRAFRGGMIDYCWVVWDIMRPTKPGQTRTIWLPKLSEPIAPIEGIA